MPHWRGLMDSDWLRACDLENKGDVTVTIARVVGGEVNNMGKKTRKPVLYFEKASKPLAIGATIGKTIERMYGSDYAGWAGKRVTLYVTTTNAMSGEVVPCIRIRPTVPTGKPRPASTAASEPSPVVPSDDEDEINRRNAEPAADEMPS